MVPIGAEVLYDKLMLEYGNPMLSMMLETSSAGIARRMACSIRSQALAVSSMRIAVFVRTCSLICPASVDGKKSWPSHGKRANTARHAPRNSGRNSHGTPTSVVSKR